MRNYLDILEDIALVVNEMNTGISGMMTPPNNVVGRENPSVSYTKEQSKRVDKKAMKNYKYKKNGKLNKREEKVMIEENYEARKAAVDRKAQQINQNTNELIMTKKPDIERPSFKLSTELKDDSEIKQKMADKAKADSEKLMNQARAVYGWARKHDKEGAVNLGNAILNNIKQKKDSKVNAGVSESCFNDIVSMVKEFIGE